MFVFLSKFLPLFVYPLGLATLLLVAALVLRRPRWRTVAIALALAILWISGSRWVAVPLVRALEWQYLPPAEYPTVEAIVLLGGGTESFQFPRPGVEMNGAGDRVVHAARLYHQGVAEHILLSGGNIEWYASRTQTPAEEMSELLQMMGVPAEALWLQDQSRNTQEDAQYSAEILRERGINQVILVTSASHMPRSVALFEHQGIEVIPAPTDYSVTQPEWDSLLAPNWQDFLVGLLPNASNLGATTGALKEHIGLFVYRLRGWTD